MTRLARLTRGGLPIVAVAIAVSGFAIAAWAVQAPIPAPPDHERQCVSTGDIPASSARKITVKWNRPFPSGQYSVIGSVSDSADGDSIELSHVVAPYAPDMVAAVVSNHDATAAHSGTLCLDASRE